ncbi:MAG: serine/threonine protein kinase, partial [Candidatus Spyradocola sp.]
MSAQNTRFVRDGTGCITHVVKRVGAAQREVYEVLRGLRDPHLPHVFTIEEADGGWDVCCEYVRGVSLEEQSGLEDAELLRVALDVTRALECIHAARPSIVHRDVKPANIVRRDEGGYVLIDFDAARIYKQTSQRDTMLMGTEGYAAPEQFGYMQTDERSDIYALGATLFELKTGRPYRPGEECPGRLRRV